MQTLGSLLGVGSTGVQGRLLAFCVVTFRDGHGDSSYSSPSWALPRSESPPRSAGARRWEKMALWCSSVILVMGPGKALLTLGLLYQLVPLCWT